jgi:hypothetical protein
MTGATHEREGDAWKSSPPSRAAAAATMQQTGRGDEGEQ